MWITANEASRRLGCTPHKIRVHAIAGRIATRCLPGQTPQFRAADIERLKVDLAK